MKYSEQYRVSCAQIFNELSQSSGSTVDERVTEVLSKYGWDKELARIEDDAFRAVIIEMLHAKALRRPMRVDESGKSAIDVELARWRAETDRIAASGECGDLIADKLVGLDTQELAGKLPRETYFVPSLGEYVSRADLPSRLDALAELRKQTQVEYRKIEDSADVLRAELFIFDELIRRGRGDRRSAETNPLAPQQH